MRRPLLALLAVLLTGAALAQCPEALGYTPEPVDFDSVLGPETLFGDPLCLLRETQRFIGNTTGIGLFRIVDRLANVLFVLFAGVALVALVARHDLELTLWFLAKLFLVGMLFGLHVEVRDLARESWYRTYAFSDRVWTMPGGVSEQLAGAVDRSQVLLPTTFGLMGIVRTGGRQLLVRTASEGIESQMGRRARQMLRWAPTLLNFMLYAIMPIVFLYGALIYLSGIQMLIFLVFFKLAAAFLMLPAGGLGMMRRLAAVYVAALLKVLWLPFMFGILIDLVLRQPMRRFNDHLQAGLDTVNDAIADLNARIPERLTAALSPREWQEWLAAIPTTIMDSLGGVLTIVVGWLLGFLMMMVLLGVGIWLMQQTSGLIGAMVGGFGGAGAIPNPIARTADLVQQRTILNRIVERTRELPPAEPPRHLPPPGGSAQDEPERRAPDAPHRRMAG